MSRALRSSLFALLVSPVLSATPALALQAPAAGAGAESTAYHEDSRRGGDHRGDTHRGRRGGWDRDERRARWEWLGSSRASRRHGADTIYVRDRAGRFEKLRLVAEGGGLELRDVLIRFADGRVYSPGTRFFLREGGAREIDLPGSRRDIESVTFRARDLPGGGRATLGLGAR
jgi:hypothetical protein